MATLSEPTQAERDGCRWPSKLPWPLPALLCWAVAWCVWVLASVALSHGLALVVAGTAGAGLAMWCSGLWRRLIAAVGFPLSALALGQASAVPPVLWLGLALPLLLAYPLRAWRDAPLFPTPADGLLGLAEIVPRHPHRPEPGSWRILDAGCGLGHGLQALQREWPHAQLFGLEWSAALALLSAWRCPSAQVRRGDMWAASWAEYEVVYIFQRPESMARAWAKARLDMKPGSFLVSLEFVVPGLTPQASLQRDGARPVWVYTVPAPTGIGTQDSTRRKLGR